MVEQQPLAALENPAFDGREIALTQHSAQLMRTLGLWERIEPHALHAARCPCAQRRRPPSPWSSATGWATTANWAGWCPTNLIRRAAFEAVQQLRQDNEDITLMAGETVASVRTDRDIGPRDARQAAPRCRPACWSPPTAASPPRAAPWASPPTCTYWPQHAGVLHDPRGLARACRLGMVWLWPDAGRLPMNDDPATGEHPRSRWVLDTAQP